MSIKENIKKTIQEIGEKNSQALEKRYNFHWCKECNKKIKYEILQNETWGKPPDFCGDECKEKDRKKKLEAFITRNIRRIPKKYIDIETNKKQLLESSTKKSLFITGMVGTGKTVFMASLAKYYIKQGMTISWISYTAFIMELQNAYRNTKFNSFGDKVNPFDIADEAAKFEGYLFVDDLGAEKPTDFVKQITYYILNEREQRMLPTIITSNFTLEEIDEFIDRRISSRICGMCEVLKFKGEDRRIK